MFGNMSRNKAAPWILLGAILMMVVGSFKLVAGIIGLFRDQYLVAGFDGYYLVDVTGLAIWWLVVGAVLVLGGLAVLRGKTWGYLVGLVAASLAAISEFFHMPYSPVWSVVMLVVYVITVAVFARALTAD